MRRLDVDEVAGRESQCTEWLCLIVLGVPSLELVALAEERGFVQVVHEGGHRVGDLVEIGGFGFYCCVDCRYGGPSMKEMRCSAVFLFFFLFSFLATGVVLMVVMEDFRCERGVWED